MSRNQQTFSIVVSSVVFLTLFVVLTIFDDLPGVMTSFVILLLSSFFMICSGFIWCCMVDRKYDNLWEKYSEIKTSSLKIDSKLKSLMKVGAKYKNERKRWGEERYRLNAALRASNAKMDGLEISIRRKVEGELANSIRTRVEMMKKEQRSLIDALKHESRLKLNSEISQLRAERRKLKKISDTSTCNLN